MHTLLEFDQDLKGITNIASCSSNVYSGTSDVRTYVLRSHQIATRSPLLTEALACAPISGQCTIDVLKLFSTDIVLRPPLIMAEIIVIATSWKRMRFHMKAYSIQMGYQLSLSTVVLVDGAYLSGMASLNAATLMINCRKSILSVGPHCRLFEFSWRFTL